MEKALQIRPGEAWVPGEGWDRVYFGDEFCPWLLPTAEEAVEGLEEAGRRGLGYTLVTPYLLEDIIPRLREVMESLKVKGMVEVVVNDYGLLELIREERWPVAPLLGRLLTRRMIRAGGDEVEPGFPRGFQDLSNLDSPLFLNFLSEAGFVGVETDHLSSGFTASAGRRGIKVSLHLPYRFVTLTGRCPWRYVHGRWDSGPCPRPCLEEDFQMTRAEDGQILYFRGSAQFITGSDPVPGPETGVDRLVSHPETGVGERT